MLHWSQGQHLWLAQAQSQHLAGLLSDTNVKNILDLDILRCNLTFYTLFSLSHRKLRPAITSTETSAMQWEARTRRPPNHFQLIEPEKGTKTIVIAPHKFMFCTYVTKRGTSGKKVALFKIKLFVSSFLATGSENCIFELSHKLDHLAKGVALRSFAPNSPERTGYMAPIVPSPIQPRAIPPPYGMIIPFSGSKNLRKGQTEPGDL